MATQFGEPKIVEKIAHSRGFTELKLEFKYHFKLKIFNPFCVR
jgi:hypothetical protein